MQKLKDISTLCIDTNETTKANVYIKNDKVYVSKEDKQGNEYHELVETNSKWYMLRTKRKLINQAPANIIQIYASSECNLKCSYCYSPKDEKEKVVTPNILKKLLEDVKKKVVVLGGREPTCNSDLPELIRIVSKNNLPVLLTNGLRLTAIEYLKELKDCGLHRIIFSMNGMDDDVFKKINGQCLLDKKLLALQNINKIKIPVELSITVIKGVNEDHVEKLYKFCIDNLELVKTLRIRSSSPVGHYASKERLTMSELLSLVANSLNFTLDSVIAASNFIAEIGDAFKIPNLSSRLCSSGFYVKKNINNGICSIVPNLKLKKMKFITNRSRVIKKILLFYFIYKEFGFIFSVFSLNAVPKIFVKFKDKIAFNKGFLKIELRRWPNRYDIDLNENKKCTSHCYLEDGKSIPFCINNIMNEINNVAPTNT